MKTKTLILAAAMVAAMIPAVTAGPLDNVTETVETPYLVRLYVLDDSLKVGDSFHGGQVTGINTAIDFITVTTIDPLFQVRVLQDENVRYVTYDDPNAMWTHATPNDPLIGNQWGWNPTPGIDAYGAWDVTSGTTATVVAVLDTGLDKAHEDIGNYLPGHDFANGDSEPEDKCGHGTHVAGTVGALTNNGVGVAGTAQTTILPVKVLEKGGMFGSCSGSWSSVANGLTYAADQGADVIQASLGCNQPCYDQTVRDALAYAYNKGVLPIFSAGNDNGGAVGFPGDQPEAMAVSALTSGGALASFSSKGPEVEIAAPGDDVYSTDRGNAYSYMDGTSMAAPHVSGVAALALAVDPTLSRDQLRNTLKANAVDLGLPSDAQGAGALNACNVVGSTTCGSGSGGGGGDTGGGDGSTAMHVHDIAHSRQGSPKTGDLLIDIWAFSGDETAVSGATVDISVSKDGGQTASGSGATTGSDGKTTYRWGGIGGGTYTTTVTNLAKSGWTWDQAAGHASGGNSHTSSV